MSFPAFFAQVPSIILRDRLAEFLGAAADGLIEYRYADAVRLAGHSCPTVAGSYLLSHRALRALYGDETALLQRLLAGDDEPATHELFARLWQERVRRILLDHFDDPRLVVLA